MIKDSISSAIQINAATQSNGLHPAIATLSHFTNQNRQILASETRVNTSITGFQKSPAIAADAKGNYIVVWTSEANQGFGSSPLPPNSDTRSVYARRYRADGTPLGGEFRVNTHTKNAQDADAVAMDDQGNFVITWTSQKQDGSGDGVYAQRHRADGTPDGREFRVNTFTAGHQSTSDVAIDANGNIIVAWDSFGQDGNGLGVFAQRFRANGTPLGTEFQVNSISSGHQGLPAIATHASGNFAITWTDLSTSGKQDIYARRFDANGKPVSSAGSTAEFRVNAVQPGKQERSDIAMAPNGEFIVTWQSLAPAGSNTSGRDNSDYGVFAQRYHANGTPNGAEFQVNTTTASSQYSPSIAIHSNGSFVITWDSWNQDGSLGSIIAQHYDANGAPWGGEVLVNTITEGGQSNPAVAAVGNRDFVVAWDSADLTPTGGGVSNIDIYSHHLAAPNPAVVGTSNNDILNGTSGGDRLEGWEGNDILKGNAGRDVLIGSTPGLFSQSNQGVSKEVDNLIGGGNADHFILGYGPGSFYRDGGTQGTASYAVIQDFNLAEDVIHLGAGQYKLSSSPINSLSGTGIFLESQAQGSTSYDLVGVVKGIQPSALDLKNSKQFLIGESLPTVYSAV